MERINKTLREIVNEHTHVVVDTSVILRLYTFQSVSRTYFDQFREILRESKHTFFTTKEVIKEATAKRNLKKFRGLRLKVYNRPLESQWIVDTLEKYLTPRARHFGILKGRNAKVNTDIRLAALAFSLVYDSNTVAFLSSDRPLNGLLYSILEDLRRGESYRHPCLCRGELNVYSLVQKVGTFIPYEEDPLKLKPEDFFN